MTITATSTRYLGDSASVSVVWIVDPELAAFASAVSSFADLVVQEDVGDDWRRVAGILKKIRWLYLTVPLLRSAPALAFTNEISRLRRWQSIVAEAAGDEVSSRLTRAANALAETRKETHSPLLMATVSHLQPDAPSRIVLADARYVSDVAAAFRKHNRHAVVTDARQAAAGDVVPLTVVVGSPAWHPAHLATAPRSTKTVYLLHNWIRCSPEVRGPLSVAGSPYRVTLSIAKHEHAPTVPEADDSPALLAPSVDWSVAKRIDLGPRTDHDDVVRARLVLLAGGRAAFIEADSGSLIDTVDFDAPGGRRVRREGTTRIAPGDFLLLRTRDGQDDIIRVLADGLLRDKAASLRERQRYWKDALRRRIGDRALDDIVGELQQAGLQTRNLRGWLKPSSIRPSLASDFRVLMEFAGIGAEAERLWAQMAALDRAHLVAGQRLRSALEAEAEKLESAKVLRDGYATVQLSVAAAGELGIFRVEAVAPTPTDVPDNKLRVIHRLEDDSWLA